MTHLPHSPYSIELHDSRLAEIRREGVTLVLRLSPAYHHAVNALAPDGSTFENAETVMYAVALYKPRMTEIASVDALIADDKKKFIEQSAAVSIDETKPLATGDGQKLRSFTFFPKSEGNWEQVAYGEEGDYYLIFTVSSRTKSGYAKALQSYEAMLRGYKAKL